MAVCDEQTPTTRASSRAPYCITVDCKDQCFGTHSDRLRSVPLRHPIGLAAGLCWRCRFTPASQNRSLLNRLNNLGINGEPARAKLALRRSPGFQPLFEIVYLEINPAAL